MVELPSYLVLYFFKKKKKIFDLGIFMSTIGLTVKIMGLPVPLFQLLALELHTQLAQNVKSIKD